MDAVWDGRSDGSGMRQVIGFGLRSMGGGNMGAIVTSGEVAA